MRLIVLRDGVPVSTTPIESDEQTVLFPSPVGAGGFVRVEVRSAPTFLPDRPLANTLDMEALTNPVWLVAGDPPAGTSPDLTLAPEQVGPRRMGSGSAGQASPQPTASSTLSAGPGSPDPVSPGSSAAPAASTAGRSLPATGPAVLLPLAGAAALVGRP